MRTTTRENAKRKNPGKPGERGASLVEVALVTPIFIVVVMAMFELSFMTHNYVKATGAASASSRAVTVAGASPPADFLAIRALEDGLSSFAPEDIELVVIYKADGADASVPVGCLSNPIPAGLECNSYTASDFFLSYTDAAGVPTGHWGCGPTARDDDWCPIGRQSGLSDPGGPDHVGVFLRIRQENVTGFFDWDRTLEVNRVSRIEPATN